MKQCQSCRCESYRIMDGLCYTCNTDPFIRGKFDPTTEKYFPPPSRGRPPKPTTALPGSRVKMAVMAWRARNGYLIFHPGDANFFGPKAAAKGEYRRRVETPSSRITDDGRY